MGKLTKGGILAIILSIFGLLLICGLILAVTGIQGNQKEAYNEGYKEGYDAAEENLKRTIKELEKKKETKQPATQPPAIKAWHQVAIFDGDGDKTTEPFKIQGSQWRVTYTLNGGEMSSFSFFAYPVGQERGYVATGDKNSPGTDVTYAYRSGEFYLKILVANGTYHIVVEDYY